MKHVHKIILLAIFFVSCKTPPDSAFNSFTIALTYLNNDLNKDDSLEVTNTVCHYLIHFDNSKYCYAYRHDSSCYHYYKGIISPSIKEHLKNTIINLQEMHPGEYEPPQKNKIYCGPDISIVLESDTVTKYHFIQHCSDTLFSEINHFITDNLQQTGINESALKYKYYITSKVAYITSLLYGFEPINIRYSPTYMVKFVPPTHSNL